MSFRKRLPSLNALVTFEAAARLKSFTGAARELSVSQAAVSRQIRLLEDEFGQALFKRGHRRVQSTPAGETLSSTLNRALEMIGETVDSLRPQQNADALTVGTTLAVSYFWLLPRLSSFYETRPGVSLRVVSQDEPFDLRTDDIDVVMRFGAPPFVDAKTVASAGDTFFPVCSPDFARRQKSLLRPEDILTLPLIGCDMSDPLWMSWPDWCERVGLGRRVPRVVAQFNRYTDGIGAAIAGQGVALGWNLILGDLLTKGQLVPLAEPIAAGGAYNVLVPHRRRTSAACAEFITWIQAMFSDSLPKNAVVTG